MNANLIRVEVLHGQGLNDAAIARDIGVSREYVRQLRNILELPKNQPKKKNHTCIKCGAPVSASPNLCLSCGHRGLRLYSCTLCGKKMRALAGGGTLSNGQKVRYYNCDCGIRWSFFIKDGIVENIRPTRRWYTRKKA